MKTLLKKMGLFLVLTISFFSADSLYAQIVIPNGDFESWKSVYSVNNFEPTDWDTPNIYPAVYGDTNNYVVEKGTPGAVGNSYLKLTSKKITDNFINKSQKLSAYALASFPCNIVPANFTGQYQYKISKKDTAVIFVEFTKWNSSTSNSDSISGVLLYITAGVQPNWTLFSLPTNHNSFATPDTARILFMSSALDDTSNIEIGDYLYIDDLAFNGISTGIHLSNS